MSKYLKEFSSHTAYDAYINSNKAVFPSVSLCVMQNEVHFDRQQAATNGYFTLKALTEGTITVRMDALDGSPVVIRYSRDGGSTWTSVATSSEETNLGNDNFSVNEEVLIKGENNSYLYSLIFGGTAQTEVYGNSMSLIYGDDFAEHTSFPLNTYDTFNGLFKGYTNLVSAENLLLPALSLTPSCYEKMFYGCTSLTTAPVLPAHNLVDLCYCEMFYNCSNLSYVKALFVTNDEDLLNISAPILNWLTNVSETGTFVKSVNSTLTESKFHIPEGWTIETE